MKKGLYITAIVLLLLLGLSAVMPGWSLLSDPSGENLGISLDFLGKSPFEDFYYPGLILFLSIGILSLIIMFLAFLKTKNYYWLIVFQGIVLVIWLSFELIYGIYFFELQIPYFVVGILLILIGIYLKNKSKIKSPAL